MSNAISKKWLYFLQKLNLLQKRKSKSECKLPPRLCRVSLTHKTSKKWKEFLDV